LYISVTSRFNVKINEQNTKTQKEILSFADQNAGFDYHVGSELDATYGAADAGDDTLQNFFSRPIKIQSYSWGTGTNLFETFNPWQDFWENDRVINRITNYNLLRCKLCVKFVLNGNGFHYGRAIASYVPLHNDDGFTKDRAFFQEDVVEASQRPHIYLDPTNSQGGTMCLPFVWQYNAMDIPDQDWRDMGDILIHGMQNLKHANGASDSVTVSVFAWAEDVVMSTPTANEPGALSAQAGEYTPGACLSKIPCPTLEIESKCCNKVEVEEQDPYRPQADEYGTGMVSTPASYIARAAGALTSAPVIGAYAKATEIGASAIAAIARTFGFSRPTYAGEIIPYKPTYLGNFANTNAPDTSNKLTLDMKQELTVDTRTMGLDGTDEMELKSIAMRESYLTNFPWDVADTTETLLWNCEVNPQVWSELTVSSQTEYHMPACCFAALPFRYWRGSMKYRFQIVASAFHKGRLKITYDPSYPLTNEYNTNYTRIIDLAEERDFTVEIGWGQQQPYLKSRPMLNGSGEIFSTSAIGSDPGILANGILSVYVVNELTVPNSTANNDIEINVFVSAGEDIEFAGPDESDIRNLSWFVPQAGEYTPQAGDMPDSTDTNQESAPMKLEPEETMAAQELDLADHTNDIYFGDPVTSIRQLLKRYCFQQALYANVETGFRLVNYTRNNFPLYRGYATTTEHEVTTPANPTDYQFSQNTFINYFTPAFTCYRGGIRWKYHFVSDQLKQYIAVQNDLSPSFATGVGDTTILNDSNSASEKARQWRNLQNTMIDGAYVVPAERNPVVEVEIPYYRPQRFAHGKQSTLDLNLGTDSYYHTIQWLENQTSTSHNTVLAYCAAADDFTLGFYTGPPVAYYQEDPLAA
jgi:hypothetical protein